MSDATKAELVKVNFRLRQEVARLKGELAEARERYASRRTGWMARLAAALCGKANAKLCGATQERPQQ